MKIVKTILRLMATCIGGFAGIWLLSDMIATTTALFLPGDYTGEADAESLAPLIGGVVGSLFACVLLVPTTGISLHRRIFCILLSPATAALGITLFVVGMMAIEVVDAWGYWALPILWFIVIPGCSFLGYHLPLFLPAKSK